MSLEAVLSSAAARVLLPTVMGTAELRRLPADLRARSLFSARTNSAPYLARVADVLERLLGGEINQATARNELQAELEELRYDPREGFADAPDADIPPAEPGSLRDISSSARINLMLDTQQELLFSAGQKAAGMTRLETWPAWELVRMRTVAVPRGFAARKAGLVPVPGAAWKDRWVAAGGTLLNGRMMALKTDPIWAALGDSSLFRDALDVDRPPFAFNSGMGWEEVRWDEWEAAAGKEAGKAEKTAAPRPLNEDLKVSVKKLPPDLAESLRKDLAAELEGSELRYKEALDRRREEYLRRGVSTGALAERERRIAEVAARRLPKVNRRAAREFVIKNRIGLALAALNGGTSEGARKGWITRRRNGWPEWKKKQAGEKIDRVLSGKEKSVTYGSVDEAMAKEIRAVAKFDPSGFQHEIGRNFLVHRDRRHGVRTESDPSQLPVTDEDIRRLPEIVSAPDAIADGGKSARGFNTIKYRKAYADGTIYFVEEEWTGEKFLAAKTIWKKKAALGNSATPEGGVSHTSGTSKTIFNKSYKWREVKYV